MAGGYHLPTMQIGTSDTQVIDVLSTNEMQKTSPGGDLL